MKLYKIAVRNIWRNRLRSIAIMASVFLGLLAGIFASALVRGMLEGRFANFIEREVSHVQVHHPDYIERKAVGLPAGYDPTDLERVLQLEGVQAATIRSQVRAMVASATYTGGVDLIGIRPEAENATTRFKEHLVEGVFIGEEESNQLLIGRALADKLRVGVGSRIVCTFQDKDNNLVSAAFVVGGLFETYYKRYDESTAFVNIDYLNRQLQIAGYHEMAILGEDVADAGRLAKQIGEVLPNARARTWYEIAPELEYWVEMGSVFSYIFVVLIMIGLAFGLLNTMLMAVFERTREIGMLMAIGMNRKRVFGLIVLETIVLAILGSTLGMLGGWLLVHSTHKSGINLGAFSDVMHEIGFETVIYPSLDPAFFYTLPVLVVVTALLAAIYPAIKALKLNPADAVRK